jgi:hypothetical protein
MTEHKTHNNKDYVCVDKDAEPLDSDTSDKKCCSIMHSVMFNNIAISCCYFGRNVKELYNT